jgi:hypothetical protein
MTKYSIIIIFLLSLAVNAQDFKVLSKSGDATKKNGSKWTALKTGESLSTKDQVKIGEKGYLVLTHQSSKKSIELNKKGTYDLKKISTDMSKGKKGVSSQLAKYFIEEISSSDDYFKKGNYKEGMEGNLGAVDRGIGGNVNANEKVSGMTGIKDKDSKLISSVAGTVFGNGTKMLYVKLPRNGYILEPENEFIWYKYSKSGPYNFKIIDRNNKILVSKSTKDTSININMDDCKLAKGTTYYWFVECDGDKSIEEPIHYLSDNVSSEINSTIKEFQDESEDSDSPMINLAIAGYLADKNINSTAYKYFKKVIDSAPESIEYKKVFAKFLIRIGDYQGGKALGEEK